MAGRQTIEAQCRRLNHARNVSEVGSYTAQQFWPAARGSFIISGGSDIKRCKMLSDKLCYEMTYDSLPGFVLTASDELEMEMIQCLQEGKTAGELHVTSRRFPNYLFFQGWESSEIVRFFIKIATLLGYDSGRLPAYIQAFLTILKCYYPLSLSSMLALSEHDDGQIARWGEEAGADSLAIAHIQNYSEEGHLFRSLLGQLKSVFSPLSAEDPNCGYSLANETFNAGELYLINVRSHSQGLVNLYFAEELELALDRCGAGYLVVADLPLREDDKLQELLEEQELRGNEVGITAKNAGLLSDELRTSFRVLMLLLDDRPADGDLRKLLEPLGTYTHYEPMLSVQSPPLSISLFHGRTWNAQAEPNRMRVRPEDTRGFAAVLYGMNRSEVILTRNLL